MAQTLDHLRILDLSRILAGPWSTQILGDMGAEVIKIERPIAGDDTRGWGPPFLEGPSGLEMGSSSYFLSANRGKKSLTVDLASEAGQRIIRDLAASSDVLVENYKVGTLKRYGLDYEALREINPRLIYCSITGFGQTGPYAELPGYDFVFQGMSGLMSITGQPHGQPGDEPMKMGVPIGDLIGGMYATTAILAAIEHRHRSGEGQHIDIALLDCATAITSYHAMNQQLSGDMPKRLGNAHANMVPYQVFRCADGDMIVAVGNDGQFRAFCSAIGHPELAADPLYQSVAQRNRNRATLIPIVAEAMLGRTCESWIELLEAINVPCGPIYDVGQVFEDPQIVHRGMLQRLPHSHGVDAPTVANPIRFSSTPIRYGRSAPLLGEHSDEVLADRLSLDTEQIAALRAQGVI